MFKNKKSLIVPMTTSIVLVIGAIAVGLSLYALQRASQSEQANSEICGGIAGVQCPAGFVCQEEDPTIADGTGTCEAEST